MPGFERLKADGSDRAGKVFAAQAADDHRDRAIGRRRYRRSACRKASSAITHQAITRRSKWLADLQDAFGSQRNQLACPEEPRLVVEVPLGRIVRVCLSN